MTVGRDQYVNSPVPIEPELRLLFDTNADLTIFDIGACEGEDAVRYARLFPNSMVYAVEPLPANVALIRATVARYDTCNVRVIPLALAAANERRQFYVSSGRPPDSTGEIDWDYGNKSSSLLTPARHLDVHPWVHFDDRIEVEVRTLADVCHAWSIERVDFVHLDVQGAELEVLQGAGQLLESLTALWLEVEAVALYEGQPLKSDVEAFLRAHGFSKWKDTVNRVSGDQLWVGPKVPGRRFRRFTAKMARSRFRPRRT